MLIETVASSPACREWRVSQRMLFPRKVLLGLDIQNIQTDKYIHMHIDILIPLERWGGGGGWWWWWGGGGGGGIHGVEYNRWLLYGVSLRCR